VPFVNQRICQIRRNGKIRQNDIYYKLLDKSSNIFPLTAQDLRVTNSLLRKAGIESYKNIDETPIDELHKILGADHIIAAKVSYTETQNQTSSTTTLAMQRSTTTKSKAVLFLLPTPIPSWSTTTASILIFTNQTLRSTPNQGNLFSKPKTVGWILYRIYSNAALFT
jgi:hypothetical protein